MNYFPHRYHEKACCVKYIPCYSIGKCVILSFGLGECKKAWMRHWRAKQIFKQVCNIAVFHLHRVKAVPFNKNFVLKIKSDKNKNKM